MDICQLLGRSYQRAVVVGREINKNEYQYLKLIAENMERIKIAKKLQNTVNKCNKNALQNGDIYISLLYQVFFIYFEFQ